MSYKQIQNLVEKEFKRLCRVKPKLFEEMVEVLKDKSKKGRPFELRFNLISGLYNCGLDLAFA